MAELGSYLGCARIAARACAAYSRPSHSTHPRMESSRAVAALLVLAALPASEPAGAQSQALAVAQIAATCAGCHGTQGRAADGASLPSLAGMPKASALASLQAFKSGARPATIMHQLAKGYTDAQLEQIADYFAAQLK